MESLINFFMELFGGLLSMKFGKELFVFFISMLPILELRGGLLAASLIGLDPLRAYIVSIIGNVLPVPFILLFIHKILKWMEKSKIKFFNKIATKLHGKVEKNKGKIEKYGYLGLVLFVGIPLPGTGAWTGCLVAAMLGLDKKKSFFAALLGIIIASIIMMAISYGLLPNLF
jgi:uncharacterized membrane protein